MTKTVCDRCKADITPLKNMFIEYWTGLAMFQAVGDFWTTDFDHIGGYDVEVIGNIYDNSELIESED